jgi:hypothetical protein
LKDSGAWYKSCFEVLKEECSLGTTNVTLGCALEIERIQKEGDLRSLEFNNREANLSGRIAFLVGPYPFR